MRPKPFAVTRLVGIVISVFIAAVVSFSLPDKAVRSVELSNTLITIFSVFAGFMIALMAVTSYLHEAKSWKEVAVSREAIEAKLLRQQLLFYGYLLTLAMIVIAIIVGHYDLWGYSDVISNFVRRGYIFVGIISLLLSFSLPNSLRKAHEQSVTEQMKKAKKIGS